MKHEFTIRDGLSISFEDVHMCYVNDLRVNSDSAYMDDFGEMIDFNPRNDGGYGCGDMRFQAYPVNPDVLKKYNISEKDYDEIAEILREHLCIGECADCA